MNNREFHEVLQEYFQSNTITLDEFLQNLPRFMMENYGLSDQGDSETGEEADYLDDFGDSEEDDDEEYDLNDEELFMAFMRRSRQEYRTEPIDPPDLLFRSLLAGHQEAREIPLRTILPQSPPPSPVPNIVNTSASIEFFQQQQQQRNRIPPRLPARPSRMRRVPVQSQLSSSTILNTGRTTGLFDPNMPEECKSPYLSLAEISPIDRNNDLPLTNEYMRRYGRITLNPVNNPPPQVSDDSPER